MKTPEELNALKEEELEQVTGGEKVYDPNGGTYEPFVPEECELCALPSSACQSCKYRNPNSLPKNSAWPY